MTVLLLALAASMVAASTAAPASAQSFQRTADGSGQASPLLAPDHWSVRAVRRADRLGLTPVYVPAQRAVPRSYIARTLEIAATNAADGPYARVAAGWLLRFEREFPRTTPDTREDTRPRLRAAGIVTGVASSRGMTQPGTHEVPPDRTGAHPLANETDGVVGGDVTVGWGRALAGHLAGTIDERNDVDMAGEAVLRIGSLRASVGHAPVGWGTGRGGGVTLGGAEPITRIEISTAEAVVLPWLLRYISPFSFHAFAGPMLADRHPGRPWLVGVSATGRIHPRITLAGHRALMGGGDGVNGRFTAFEAFEAMIGRNVAVINQIASTSIDVRLPTERLIPISVYCEWGAEDSSGAPFSAPGLVCGGTSASLPAVPVMGVTVEHAQFGARPIGGPPWYRHHMFPGNWVGDEAPLGHPVGGEGRQWLVAGNISAMGGELQIDVQGVRRIRTGENLYLPGREGRSYGVGIRLDHRGSGAVGWRVDAGLEDGDGWREARIRAVGTLRF